MPIPVTFRLPIFASTPQSPWAPRPARVAARPSAIAAASVVFPPPEGAREPAWRARDYTRAAKLAPRVSPTELGPESMPFPANFGVELEMDGPDLRATRLGVAHALGVACKGRSDVSRRGVTDETGRLWQVKPDEGTLVEVASPVLGNLQGLRQVQSIASTMADRGARTHETTGVHFHVDARQMELPHMVRLIALLARHERPLYRALGVYSGRADYCLPMQKNNVEELLQNPPTSTADMCETYRGPYIDRQRGLNVENLLNVDTSKVTLEFRYFNGTLSPHLIGCYAGLVMGLTDYAMASRHIPAPNELKKEGSIPALLRQINLPPTHPVSTLLMGRMLAAM